MSASLPQYSAGTTFRRVALIIVWLLGVLLGNLLTPSSAAVQALSPGWSAAAAMHTARSHHTATLLADGRVLVAGGSANEAGNLLDSAEIYNPATGVWSTTASMAAARGNHTATLLPDGRVLVVGGSNSDGTNALASAEIYNPITGAWSAAGALPQARGHHTSTLLPDGRVLVAGGQLSNIYPISVAIYEPAANTWSSAASMAYQRAKHTATLLPDGRVLVAGGGNNINSYLNRAEIYDPAANTWSPAANLPAARKVHTATLLPDGRVLIAGGWNGTAGLTSAALYDPADNTWSTAGSLAAGRYGHSTTLLSKGQILVTGGWTGSSYLASAELYALGANTWSAASDLAAARSYHTATLLADGRVLVTGGWNGTAALASAVLYTSAEDGQGVIASMPINRYAHTTTLLMDGRVLVAGGYNNSVGGVISIASATTYNPADNTWSIVNMLNARTNHTATLLMDGRVLVVGGWAKTGYLASTEIYDPVANSWSAAASMTVNRALHTATLLPDGRVLVTGGENYDNNTTNNLASAMIYNPATDTWSTIPPMTSPHKYHTATLLVDGRVLVVGTGSAANNEIYDPLTNTWVTAANNFNTRTLHTATLLADGRVLVAGGTLENGYLTNGEIYDPAANTWSQGGQMNILRRRHSAVLLPDGRVLVAGGETPTNYLSSREIYDPASNTWGAAASMGSAHSFFHTSTLLADGRVLLVGGEVTAGNVAGIEIYDPGLGFSASRRPLISSALLTPLATGLRVHLTGSGLRGDSEASGGGTNQSASNIPVVRLQRLDNDQVYTLCPDASQGEGFSDTSYTASISTPLAPPAGAYRITVFVNGIPSQAALVTLFPNHKPIFTQNGDVTVNEDAGATLSTWASAISAGPDYEAFQTLNLIYYDNNHSLFAEQPTPSLDGALSFTPAVNANGFALVTVILMDNGGTANGGNDYSTTVFKLIINPVNDAPTFTKGANQVVQENAAAQIIPAWMTNLSAGPADESSQTLSITVSNDNNALFTVQPAISADGTLNYTPAANAHGLVTVTVTLQDNGGTLNGGVDRSSQTFTITINPITTPPGSNPRIFLPAVLN